MIFVVGVSDSIQLTEDCYNVESGETIYLKSSRFGRKYSSNETLEKWKLHYGASNNWLTWITITLDEFPKTQDEFKSIILEQYPELCL